MIKRRTLLRNMSLLSAGACLAGCKGQTKSSASLTVGPVTTNVLNVYLHGLFAYVLNNATQKIEIYIPTVQVSEHSHVYRAGSWTKPRCGSKDPHEPDLKNGETYTLSLKDYSGDNRFPVGQCDSAPCLPLTGNKILDFIDPSILFCSLVLPPTILLRPAHRVFRKDHKAVFEGRSAVQYNVNPQFLARTFVFTYASTSAFQPALIDSQGNSFWQPQTATDALHIFAEPENDIQEGEEGLAVQAFGRLTAMFKNNFVISPTQFKLSDFRAEVAANQEPEEETSLGERHCVPPPPVLGGGGGVGVANCVGYFVTFTQS